MIQTAVIYSDFNCPFCYALNERLNSLGLAGRITWRGVQHAPHLPAPMARWSGNFAEELRREVEAVRRLAPDLPIAVPASKPNTGRAIGAAALAFGVDQQRGEAFKDMLYRALWCEGLDLSSSSILDRLAWTAGLGNLSFAALDSRLISSTTVRWQQDWDQVGTGAVPVMVRQDGASLIGLAERDQIVAFLNAPAGESSPR